MGLPAAAAAAAAGLNPFDLAALAAQSDAADARDSDTADFLRANGQSDAAAALPYPDDDDAASVTLSLRSIERSVRKAATSVVMAGAAAMGRTGSAASRRGVISSGYGGAARAEPSAAVLGRGGSGRAVTPARLAAAARMPLISSAGRPASAVTGARAATASTHAVGANSKQSAHAPSAAASLLQECADLMAEAEGEGALPPGREGSSSDATARGAASLTGTPSPASHMLLWPVGALPRPAEGAVRAPDTTITRTDDGMAPGGSASIVPGTARVRVDALPVVSWTGELLVVASSSNPQACSAASERASSPTVVDRADVAGCGTAGVAGSAHSVEAEVVHRAASRPALQVGDVILGVHPCNSSSVLSSSSADAIRASAVALADLATLLRRYRLATGPAVPADVADEAEGLTGSRSSLEPGTAGHAAAAASSGAWESMHAEGSPGAEPVLDALDSSTNITAQPEAAAEKAGESPWRLIIARPLGRSVEWH